MESITLKLTGKNQLLTHNNTAANPMSIEAKELKERLGFISVSMRGRLTDRLSGAQRSVVGV